MDNIHELASNLIKYEQENPDGGLSGFLEEVSLFTDIDNYDSESDSVVMMTMHSAKGLEFPVVFLPGFEEGIFPGIQAIYNPGEIEEERRLAYVAITRAKEELFLLNAESRMLFGSVSRNRPSRFIEEIPEELLVHTYSRSRREPQPDMNFSMSFYGTRATRRSDSAHTFGPSAISGESAKGLKVGDQVEHKTFGVGMVISATEMGNDTLLEIAFEKVGTKKLMSNFARLKKLG